MIRILAIVAFVFTAAVASAQSAQVTVTMTAEQVEALKLAFGAEVDVQAKTREWVNDWLVQYVRTMQEQEAKAIIDALKTAKPEDAAEVRKRLKLEKPVMKPLKPADVDPLTHQTIQGNYVTGNSSLALYTPAWPQHYTFAADATVCYKERCALISELLPEPSQLEDATWDTAPGIPESAWRTNDELVGVWLGDNSEEAYSSGNWISWGGPNTQLQFNGNITSTGTLVWDGSELKLKGKPTSCPQPGQTIVHDETSNSWTCSSQKEK